MLIDHYKPKKISEIKKTDNKIAIVGKVVETKESSFILDDKTGKIEVVFEGEVTKGKLIRVFCSLIDDELRAEIVQDLSGLDLNLFKKTEELYKSTGV